MPTPKPANEASPTTDKLHVVVIDCRPEDRYAFAPLEDDFQLTIYEHVPHSEAETIRRGADADIIITLFHRTAFTPAVLRSLPRTRLIATRFAGVDSIDVDTATDNDILVANVPGGSGPAVAEFAFTGLLAVIRNLRDADAMMRSGDRSAIGTDGLQGTELYKKTMGIVGFGSIGQHAAKIARGFGMRVIAWNRSQRPELTSTPGVESVDLDELVRQADIISLHSALGPETEDLLSRERLQTTKSGVILVNTARGGLVDEDALLDLLRSGHIAGAFLDVFAVEPPPTNHPLLQLDNVVSAPHLAWFTRETIERQFEETCRIAREFGAGRLLNVVNAKE